jgi:stearoyl-CoA desaturase (delta-9 desaturase)
LATHFEERAQREGLNWTAVLAFIFFHIGAVVALFNFTWPAFFAFLVLYYVSLSFGIGMGYHRLLTHQGYVPPKWVEYFLAICGTLALEGGPLSWVTTHRIHHRYSDLDGDPHSPNDGKWWSHLLWMTVGNATNCTPEEYRKYSPDLMRDRFLVTLSKYFWVPVVVVSLALLALGGLPWLLWGTFFRVTVGWHATWLVNSGTHLWGPRRFETTDMSRNNRLISILTFGEGWHNNHHAFPTSARHGLAWHELDISWLGIRTLKALGLAKHVRTASVDAKYRPPVIRSGVIIEDEPEQKEVA